MITAIVPARSGSKRLPGKNIKLLAGKPLLLHTLDAVLGHNAISKIVFTTDSDEYISLVEKEYGARVQIEKRPSSYAQDTTKVHDEIFRLAQNSIIDTEWFMLCLPTAPLRNYQTVEKALKFWEKEKTGIFSASEYNFPVQFAFDILPDGSWEPTNENSPMLTGETRSQDIQKRYRPNGAIYVNKTKSLQTNKTFYIDAKPFLISDRESTDVDTETDFLVAEQLIKQKVK